MSFDWIKFVVGVLFFCRRFCFVVCVLLGVWEGVCVEV